MQIQDVSLKIAHAHIESAELCLQNLARLDIYLVPRCSPIVSLIGQPEVALKHNSRIFFHVKMVQISNVSVNLTFKYTIMNILSDKN